MRQFHGRLDRMHERLTARERALLVLRAWKQGEQEDPMVMLTMPGRQTREYNRLIRLMNGAYRLAPYVLGLKALTDLLGMRLGWLATLDLWALAAGKLGHYVDLHTREPVTESEHRRLEEKARAGMVPVAELAELLTERFEGWAEDDLKEDEDDGEPAGRPVWVVTDAAWKRVKGRKREELARLVDEGVLQGRRQGRRLLVNAASFYRWLGEEVPVGPDWGCGFEVMPDDRADEVQRLRRARERAREALANSPSSPWAGDVDSDSWGDGIAAALSQALRQEAENRWRELLAAETVIDEVAAEFDGEDPLPPDVRETLQDVRERLEKLLAEIEDRLGGLDLAEPDEGVLEELRTALELPSSA